MDNLLLLTQQQQVATTIVPLTDEAKGIKTVSVTDTTPDPYYGYVQFNIKADYADSTVNFQDSKTFLDNLVPGGEPASITSGITDIITVPYVKTNKHISYLSSSYITPDKTDYRLNPLSYSYYFNNRTSVLNNLRFDLYKKATSGSSSAYVLGNLFENEATNFAISFSFKSDEIKVPYQFLLSLGSYANYSTSGLRIYLSSSKQLITRFNGTDKVLINNDPNNSFLGKWNSVIINFNTTARTINISKYVWGENLLYPTSPTHLGLDFTYISNHNIKAILPIDATYTWSGTLPCSIMEIGGATYLDGLVDHKFSGYITKPFIHNKNINTLYDMIKAVDSPDATSANYLGHILEPKGGTLWGTPLFLSNHGLIPNTYTYTPFLKPTLFKWNEGTLTLKGKMPPASSSELLSGLLISFILYPRALQNSGQDADALHITIAPGLKISICVSATGYYSFYLNDTTNMADTTDLLLTDEPCRFYIMINNNNVSIWAINAHYASATGTQSYPKNFSLNTSSNITNNPSLYLTHTFATKSNGNSMFIGNISSYLITDTLYSNYFHYIQLTKSGYEQKTQDKQLFPNDPYSPNAVTDSYETLKDYCIYYYVAKLPIKDTTNNSSVTIKNIQASAGTTTPVVAPINFTSNNLVYSSSVGIPQLFNNKKAFKFTSSGQGFHINNYTYNNYGGALRDLPFCFECFILPTNGYTYDMMGIGNAATTNYSSISGYQHTSWDFYTSAGTKTISLKTDLPTNKWTHFCVLRIKNAPAVGTDHLRVFYNGELFSALNLPSSATVNQSLFPPIIGRYAGVGYSGYIDEIRLTLGASRYYTTSFTPPTQTLSY